MTESLFLGAYALSEGAVLKRVVVTRANGRTTAAFDFEAPNAEKLTADFYSEAAVVNLARFREHLESLKDELFGALRRAQMENEDGARRKTHGETRQGRDRGYQAAR